MCKELMMMTRMKGRRRPEHAIVICLIVEAFGLGV